MAAPTLAVTGGRGLAGTAGTVGVAAKSSVEAMSRLVASGTGSALECAIEAGAEKGAASETGVRGW